MFHFRTDRRNLLWPRCFRGVLLTLAATGLMGEAAHAECRATIGIPGNQPFTGLVDGKITGVIAETTVLALRTLGCEAQPWRMPFTRMYRWVHEGRLDVATSVLKTPDRSARAYYSAPIVTEYTVVMVSANESGRPVSLRELQEKRVGGLLGFRYPPLEGSNISLRLDRSYQESMENLVRGNLDAVLTGSITGPFLIRKLGYERNLGFLAQALGTVPLGAAFSHRRFTPKERDAFDRAVTKIRNGPHWSALLERNGVTEFARPWPVIRLSGASLGYREQPSGR